MRAIAVNLRTALILVIATTGLSAQQKSQAEPAAHIDCVAPAQSLLQDRMFRSEALARSMRYRILLPDGYFQTQRSYPTLYLLHGWHGDYLNWSTRTNLVQYAGTLPIIIVMPDAGDSWYTDSASRSEDKFEQYIIHDLIEEIDQHWRTIRSPHRRAIAGLSMGGYGAVKFALKYPEVFRVAASLSGAFNASTDLENERPDLKSGLSEIFGPPASKSRTENDIYELAAHVDVSSAPYLFVDCGTQDPWFLDANRKFLSILGQRKFAYEYHETSGAHTWQYWDERVPEVLKIVSRYIVAEQ